MVDVKDGNATAVLLTLITASMRLVTFNVLRMAVTWFFTVGSAKLRARQIALLLFPCSMNARTSRCRAVRPRQMVLIRAVSASGHFSVGRKNNGSSRAMVSLSD